MSADSHLLTIVVPISERDGLVDFFMTDHRVSGFTATDSQGFSREHSGYNMSEQIAGYRAMSRFEILGNKALLQDVKSSLDFRIPSGKKAWIVALNNEDA